MIKISTISSASAALAAQQITARDLCETVIELILKIDGDLHAFSDLIIDRARNDATASDLRRGQGRALGPLDGIPVAVKNLIDTMPASCGAGLPGAATRKPAQDAKVVSNLRSAGAVVLGVTQTDAGGFGTTTPLSLNPLVPEHIAGGSSGGSAVAVASGMAHAALGTDTGGSIRIPAACCSIYGFKPSWGRVDMSGVSPLAPSFDHIGAMARSMGDLITLQQVIDPRLNDQNAQTRRRSWRIGVASAFFQDASAEVHEALSTVRRRLEDAGVDCVPVTLPRPNDFMRIHVENALKEAYDHYCELSDHNWLGYPDVARESLEIGAAVTKTRYAENDRARSEITKRVEGVFTDVDAVLLPTLPIDVPNRAVTELKIGDQSKSVLEATIHYTALFNLTGHPVVSMPGAATSDGRAISIQLVGARSSDGKLLRLANWVQSVLDIQIEYERLRGAWMAQS